MALDEAGLEDAAILLKSLGEEEAAGVLRHLSPREVRSLGETIARMTSVPKDRLDKVMAKFASTAESRSPLVADTGNYVRNVLKKALDEDKANLLIDRILHDGKLAGIEGLKWMDAASIGEMLRHEHPQIVAAVLVRVATLDGIQPSALKDLSDVMGRMVAGGEQARLAPLGGVKTAAEMINLLGTVIETAAIDYIRETDNDLAQRILDNLFTFDDLMRVDDRGIQALLKEVQSEALVVALKGAKPELREKVLKNMSTRAAETLQEEIDARGPVRVAEVEAEQKELLKVVRRLAEEGQLVLGGGSGDDFL